MSQVQLSYDTATDSTPNPFVNPSPLNARTGKRRQNVAIVGFEEQNGQTAPYDDPDWDVFGFNMANRLGFMRDSHDRFRADRWFDLHEEHAQSEKDMAWINACPVPIYLPSRFGSNPHAEVFDLEAIEAEILSKYGRIVRTDYFASSFALAFAMALSEGYTTIGLFGVSLDWGRERVVERGNLEYWIGVAEGLGVTVVLGERVKLCTHPGIYGIEYDKEKQGVIRLCGELMRQLLQSPDIAHTLDETLQLRTEALLQLRRDCGNAVQRLIFQSPEGRP